MQSTAYGFCLTSSKGRTSLGATYIFTQLLQKIESECGAYRIVFSMDGEEGDTDSKKGIGGCSIAVVGTFRGVAPGRALKLSIKFVQICRCEDSFNVDIRVLLHCLHVTECTRLASMVQALNNPTYWPNTFFRLVASVLEYTSRPIHVLCSANEPASRFHGFETTTAALSSHLSPCSPTYCTMGNQSKLLDVSSMIDSKHTYIREDIATERKANTKERSVGPRLARPLDHLLYIPRRLCIEHVSACKLRPRATPRVYDQSLPRPSRSLYFFFADERCKNVTKVQLITTTAEAVQRNQHRRVIVRGKGLKLGVTEEGGPRW